MNEKDLVLGNVLQAVMMLEKSHSFAYLIPEVRTNLVYALPNAKSKEDVAGIEGRITVVNGYPKASGFPKFGASSHMARFIIEIMKVNPEMRRKFASVEGIDYRVGEAKKLPIHKKAVDYAFANMFLHHVESPSEARNELPHGVSRQKHKIYWDRLL
ncbi:MAG: thiamine-phosphate synthase family protein [candidate division WOR-3 bacterium]|nr:thiamine-phosphate synthase family protein [candidate division WOR-3 bacterium]